MMKTVQFQYSGLMKFLHWVMAVFIIGLLVIGFLLDDFEGPDKAFWMMIHKSSGLLVGALLVLRIIARMFSAKAPVDQNKGMQFLAGATVLGLYASMVGMVVSGYLMSSFAGYSIDFYKIVEIPSFIEKNHSMAGVSNQIHTTIPLILCGAMFLHILGSLYHFFIRKDQVLQRMLPACSRKK